MDFIGNRCDTRPLDIVGHAITYRLPKRNGCIFEREKAPTDHFYGSATSFATRVRQRIRGKSAKLLAQPQRLRQERQYIFQTGSRALKMVEPSVLLLRRNILRDNNILRPGFVRNMTTIHSTKFIRKNKYKFV